ncbi:MAG: S1 RNA-binding domain-containing protein, partial [Planctomycetes bacterium]|nr:S1 RNA-binding domain-containing protein [Planctomycetota bacterium]
GLKQLTPNPWETSIPDKYRVGNAVKGKVTKLVSFGAFVELEKDLEGLLHVSKVDKEAEQAGGLAVGDLIEVKVVKLEPNEGKIGLSLGRILEKVKPKEVPPPAAAEAPPAPPAASGS